MGLLRGRMEADLKLAGYSPSTRKIYLLYARLFAKHFMRSPQEMGETEIRAFVLLLVEERRTSPETYRQVRAALRFLYFQTLRRPVDVEWLPTRRRGKRLPLVVSGTDFEALLAAVRSRKYHAILMTLYGGGAWIWGGLLTARGGPESGLLTTLGCSLPWTLFESSHVNHGNHPGF